MSHLPNWQEYGVTSGSDKQKDPVAVHNETYGTYKDEKVNIPVDERLPTANMPQAPDPTPFAVK